MNSTERSAEVRSKVLAMLWRNAANGCGAPWLAQRMGYTNVATVQVVVHRLNKGGAGIVRHGHRYYHPRFADTVQFDEEEAA